METLINVDLSQAELRVMAVMSGDEWMISSLQEDSGDFFDNHFMPIAFPEKLEKFATIDIWKKMAPADHKECRVQVKSVMYGLAFGRGSAAIAVEIGQSEAVARKIIDNLFYQAPKFKAWREDIKVAATNPAYRDMLVNPFGRRYQRELITSRRQEAAVIREALSFLPQSTSSDICLATCIRINEPLADQGYHIFNVVHDAIMIKGPEDNAEFIGQYVGAELRETGRMVMGDAVPFLSDYSVGKNWGELS
jgi:DNA polymerase I-like protein with 3'-5' exonuclease and polymerase domains